MNLLLKFKNIQDCNGVPRLKITANGILMYDGDAQPSLDLVCAIQDHSVRLLIEHYGKDPNQDTVVKHGVIVSDRSCELDGIVIDGIDLEELKWQSSYLCDDGSVLDKCLFFGKNGTWSLEFELPILKWMLGTRHRINNNDPNWSQDYESYIQACKLLNNLT